MLLITILSTRLLKIRVSVVRFRPWPPFSSRCIPITSFTPYFGHMVNTLSGVNGLNGGFAASPFGRLSALRASDRTGSTRSCSLSKKPRSCSIKLTCQAWSSTSRMPTSRPENTLESPSRAPGTSLDRVSRGSQNPGGPAPKIRINIVFKSDSMIVDNDPVRRGLGLLSTPHIVDRQ